MTNLFLERRESFGWHDGQQIPGASLQVQIFKDLVTLSDPTNAFSFLSYLHSQGRIYHFINAQFDAVPRREFRNYMAWASRKNENVVFGEEVLAVEFDGVFQVHTTRRTVSADNISVGVGSEPWVPPQVRDQLSESQMHVCDFVPKARGLAGKRVVVVGGGQSGAEAVLDLISRADGELPRRVTWISRRANYFPIDDSPFTNDYYMPSHSDHFFSMERAAREAFTAAHVLTSDGISEATLREIYQRAYMHRFAHGAEDLIALYPNRNVTEITRAADGWDLTVLNNGYPDRNEHIEADVVIWATGFRPTKLDFLAPIAGRLETEGDEPRIDQDFALVWDGPPNRNVFLQNAARQQRGLADPNLSLLAWRSQRIVDRLRGVRSDDQLASFIEWSTKAPGDQMWQV